MENKGNNIKEKRLMVLLDKLSLSSGWFEVSEKVEEFLNKRREIELDLMFEEFYSDLSEQERVEFDKELSVV